MNSHFTSPHAVLLLSLGLSLILASRVEAGDAGGKNAEKKPNRAKKAGGMRDPRGILTERTARWEDEIRYEGADETSGAESNPTGHPIGGGKGYGDMVKRGQYTVRNLDGLRKALEAAKDGEVVFLPDGVDIDLSGQPPLILPRGVTLAGTRGQGKSLGARLFSTKLDTPQMIKTGGPYGRITGLRIEGPHKERKRVGPASRGIWIEHFGVEVDNCELWGFATMAVYVRPGAIRAYVHHCNLHHNIRDGLGYGVCIDSGTVLIEANIFDHGRHYIASTGRPGSGYEARYNISGPSCTSHQFDMHGGGDRGDGTDIAGDWLNIHHNTFLAKQTAVGIRGAPSQRTRVHHNRFVHGTEKANVVTLGNTSVSDNVLGPVNTEKDK